MEIVFRKTGKEVKTAIANRRLQLAQRLKQHNRVLDQFLKNTPKVRSYLVRRTKPDYSHRATTGYALYGKDDISSEERQEIDRLCVYIRHFKCDMTLVDYMRG